MRISYIAPNATIPSQEANSVQIMKMANAFSERGHDVTLITPEVKHEVDNIYGYYDVDDCFEILRVSGQNWLYCRPLITFSHMIAAVHKANKYDPGFIFTRSPVCGYLGTLVDIPVVVESHDPFGKMPRGEWIECFFKLLQRNSRLSHIITTNKSLKEYYISKYNVSKSGITVVHNAADPVDETCSPVTLPRQDEKLQVGYIGSLHKGKGMSLIEDLTHACPWADFHIVGGGEDDVSRWERKTQHQQNLYFHGFVPQRDLDRYRLAFDVLLAPYQQKVYSGAGTDISDFMSPLKVFEYMSAGRPMIVSDLPVLREVLQDEVTALFCSPKEVDEWRIALERLATNHQLRKRLGSNCKEYYRNNHTWKKRAQSIINSVTE